MQKNSNFLVYQTKELEARMPWGGPFVTDSASALAHWSHLYCKTCVAIGKAWENLIGFRELLVYPKVPAFGSSGISFTVPSGIKFLCHVLHSIAYNIVGQLASCGVRTTYKTGSLKLHCYSSDLAIGD